MIRFLLTRLFPVGASVAIFGTALSPVKPTLDMFAAAADALAGETQGHVDVSGLDAAAQAQHRAAMESAPHKKELPRGNPRSRAIEALADQLGKSDEDAFGWKPGDRAAKPLAPPKPGK